MFETRTESKLYVLLGSNGPEPMGKGRLGIKTGDFALRRMEDNVQRFAVGLTLHAGQGQIEIKMLLLQMAQLMLKRLLTLLRGETGISKLPSSFGTLTPSTARGRETRRI